MYIFIISTHIQGCIAIKVSLSHKIAIYRKVPVAKNESYETLRKTKQNTNTFCVSLNVTTNVYFVTDTHINKLFLSQYLITISIFRDYIHPVDPPQYVSHFYLITEAV
jgi:hypothetical protein